MLLQTKISPAEDCSCNLISVKAEIMIKLKPINEPKIKRKLDLKTPANVYPKEQFEI